MSRPPVPGVPTPLLRRPNPSTSKMNRNSIDISTLPFQMTPSRRLQRRFSNVSKESSPDLMAMKMRRSTCSYSPKSLPLPEMDYRVVVEFLENYGDPLIISCSEIDFLGPDKISLPVVSVVSSDANESQNQLRKLCNRSIIKDSIEDAWTRRWNGEPYRITFSLSSLDPPQYIRVWNNRKVCESNVKRIKVICDDSHEVEIVVPMDFGCVFRLYDNDIPSFDIRPGFDKNAYRITDSDGLLPVPLIGSVQIDLLETFDRKSEYLGLNSIEIFGTDGEYLTHDKIVNVTTNVECLTSPFKLMKEKVRLNTIEDQWIAKKSSDRPSSLFISFARPLQIAMIRIWNFNGKDSACIYGVSKVKISTDSRIQWIGALNQAKGLKNLIEDSVTDIWLIDGQSLRSSMHINDLITTRKRDDHVDSSSESNTPRL